MCYDSNARPPVPDGEARPTRSEDLTLTAADNARFMAYLARPQEGEQARVLIFPDVRGLHGFYKDLAVRFAEQGIATLAVDYFGRTAGLTPRDDRFEYMPHVQQFRFDQFEQDIDAALAYLDGQTPPLPTFTIGFCMGGALSFLTGARPLPLAGVIGLYARLTHPFGGGDTVLQAAPRIRHPLLGLFGGADQGIPVADVEAFDRTLDETGIDHEIVIYPDAPHSFFDRHAARYTNESRDVWTRVLAFIASHSGQPVAQGRS